VSQSFPPFHIARHEAKTSSRQEGRRERVKKKAEEKLKGQSAADYN
jgi:hypothetical protein